MLYTDSKLVICQDFAHLYKYSEMVKYGYFKNKPVLSVFDDDLSQLSLNIAKTFKKPSIREDSNIYRAKRAVRDILQCNSNLEGFKPIFITLTFADEIFSLDIAHKEYELFIKRLNYQVYGIKCSRLKYLVVPEFQKSGRVHYHVVFFNLPYINRIYDFIRDVWGEGYVFVETVYSTNHLVNYVSKYFTKDLVDDRLSGRKAYFCSRGLKRPEVFVDFTLFDKLLIGYKYQFNKWYNTDWMSVNYTLYKLYG